MNELIIQLITISIVLFIAFVGFAIIAINNWNKLEIKKRSVAVLRKERDDAKNNEIETTSAYLSMCNKCDRQNNMVRKLNRENLQLRDTNERVSDDYHTVTDLNDTLQSKIAEMNILLACKVDELEKPQVVKSKLSKIELNMIQAATKTLDILVQSMPMLSPMEIDAFTRCANAIEDMKLATKSLLIWENDEFYLLPIKTMVDLVDTVGTVIQEVNISDPEFAKVLEVARAKIVLALDNKPQNKE